jgi:signal transduction histidine kinase
LIIDAKAHVIVDANEMAIMMIGVPLEQLVGKKCIDYICVTDNGKCPVTDLGQTIDHSERVLRNIDGELIPIQKSAAKAVIDSHPYLIESFVDLTQLKRLEAEHIKREKLQAAFEIAGAVCHEMNQPLQAIVGQSELLIENGNLDVATLNKIKLIKDQADRMGAVTRKLTRITRYETKEYLDCKIIDLDRSAR